jgi:hypothetical protein
MTHVSNEMMMEVMGWSRIISQNKNDLYCGAQVWVREGDVRCVEAKDYTHDLNLVHEIEAGLSGEEWRK